MGLAADLCSAPPRVRLILGDDVVRVGLVEGNDRRLKVVGVLVCSTQLSQGVLEPTGHYGMPPSAAADPGGGQEGANQSTLKVPSVHI